MYHLMVYLSEKLIYLSAVQKHLDSNKYLLNKLHIIELSKKWISENAESFKLSESNIIGLEDEFKQFNHIQSLIDLE